MFPLLDLIFIAAKVNRKNILQKIRQHSRELSTLNIYFPENEDPHKGKLLINNTFLGDTSSLDKVAVAEFIPFLTEVPASNPCEKFVCSFKIL